MALLVSRWEAFDDLRALADVQLERDGTRERFTGVLLIRKNPPAMRFEALSPFGQPFLFVVVHGGELVMYNAAANHALTGPATAESMEKLLHMAFDPNELVGLLGGRPAPSRDIRRAEIEVPEPRSDDERSSQAVRLKTRPVTGLPLVLVSPLNQQRFWMDFETGVVHKVEISGGAYEIEVAYERADGGEVRALQVTAPRASIAASLVYRDVVVDGGIDPERFRLPLPATANIERLR
jgi:hypothetical protein